MNAAVVGFSNRVGMVTKRRVAPTRIVLAAISAGVSVTSAGTTGLAESLTLEKSPAYKLACGKVVLRNRTGLALQRRSYAIIKKVFLWLNGTGPLKLPPVSF